MELPKAIAVLSTLLTNDPQFSPDKRRDAIKLGIEALERCQLARKETSFVGPGLLPGETEE